MDFQVTCVQRKTVLILVKAVAVYNQQILCSVLQAPCTGSYMIPTRLGHSFETSSKSYFLAKINCADSGNHLIYLDFAASKLDPIFNENPVFFKDFLFLEPLRASLHQPRNFV
jgi:hypothetical protein